MDFEKAFNLALNDKLLMQRKPEYGYIAIEYRPTDTPYKWLMDADTGTWVDQTEFDYLSNISGWELVTDFYREEE